MFLRRNAAAARDVNVTRVTISRTGSDHPSSCDLMRSHAMPSKCQVQSAKANVTSIQVSLRVTTYALTYERSNDPINFLIPVPTSR